MPFLFSFSHRNSLQHPKRTITYMNGEKYSYLLKIIIRKIRMVTEICSSVGKWTGSSAEIHSFLGYVSGVSSVVSLTCHLVSDMLLLETIVQCRVKIKNQKKSLAMSQSPEDDGPLVETHQFANPNIKTRF